MRAVLKAGPTAGFTYVANRTEPDLAPGQVRIEVEAASVCGTDADIVAYGPGSRALGLRTPITIGHEMAGTVVEIGPSTAGLRVGDRVAVETHLVCGSCFFCRNGLSHNCANVVLLGIHVDGAFAERVVVPAATCFVLPDDFDIEAATLLESAGSAMHAVLRASPLPEASVLITGAGPVGAVLAQIALARGARSVCVVEPNAARRATVAGCGVLALDTSADPLGAADPTTKARGGFDVGFECSGATAAFGTLLQAVRTEGTVVAVGLSKGEFPLSVTQTLITRGLTLRGSFGRSLWSTWDHLVTLVAADKVDLAGLVTDRLPLSGLQQALDLMTAGAGKVLLLPALPD